MRCVYRDYESPLEVLLEKDGSVKFHVKKLRTLMLEVFKTLHHLNPEFMWDMFVYKQTSYTSRCGRNLILPPTRTCKFGLSSLSYRHFPSEEAQHGIPFQYLSNLQHLSAHLKLKLKGGMA